MIAVGVPAGANRPNQTSLGKLTRRKGELSPSRVDSEWPHQFMLPSSVRVILVCDNDIRGEEAAPKIRD
jgi:hypothetical protein